MLTLLGVYSETHLYGPVGITPYYFDLFIGFYGRFFVETCAHTSLLNFNFYLKNTWKNTRLQFNPFNNNIQSWCLKCACTWPREKKYYILQYWQWFKLRKLKWFQYSISVVTNHSLTTNTMAKLWWFPKQWLICGYHGLTITTMFLWLYL